GGQHPEESPAGSAAGSPWPTAGDPGAGQCAVTQFDCAILRESFAYIEPLAEKAVAYFYARLFVASPELRSMFPLAMDAQRKHFIAALARTVWSMDDPQALTGYLRKLAIDHRKFGVREDHYQAVGEILV